MIAPAGTAPAQPRATELTLRGVVLGMAITLVFTAANVYLGLRVGLTIASSIPAAVISMAVLSAFPHSNIRENNIVQTVASAAGALASIIFVLPGLVIVGWWTGFPFWESFLLCASGGILGVLFTIPLRRALVTTSDLPYPEGVAAAEVLKVGDALHGGGAGAAQAREGLAAILIGSISSAGFAVFTATHIAAGELTSFFRLGGNSATGYNLSFSLALLGAGHLVGLSVGMAMLIGLTIAWAVAIPILTGMQTSPPAVLEAQVMSIWSTQVRFIGAGAMAIAALWTLAKLAHPLVTGFARTLAASRAHLDSDDQTDRDMSGRSIVALVAACLVVIAALLWNFASGSAIGSYVLPLTLAAIPFVVLAGFVIAAICGYMAGLIGSSNSPVSGVGILSVVTCSAIFMLIAPANASTQPALVAFALFTTAIVFGVAVTSNDNLQDLKTGQLVGAAPWRQQIALIIGILAGAVVIPPILNLLAEAYGFAGAPNTAAVAARPLPAPQANLISTLAQGVIGGTLNWSMIGIGAVIGVAAVILDAFLGAKKWMRLPPLAIGMGIYLPMSATLTVMIGSVIGWWYNRRAAKTPNPQRAEHLGVLVASGMIVGESLFGVLLAGLIVALNEESPFALVGEFGAAGAVGLVSFVALIAFIYGWMLKRAGAATQ
jgi:putative OPT family oligopeptide transporter